ncbi:MAG: Ribose transport system permease protein RbsC [Planctomycetes bacterium ADurb.Bin126]|nr:MAG: Ribose transport system permease protein RbsC [Planctomycetes bacterium ADurb.Bin126]
MTPGSANMPQHEDISTPPPPRPLPIAPRYRTLRAIVWEYGILAFVLAALILFFGQTTDRFLTWTNFETLANRTLPAPTILAVGMTLVLIIGGIDLSVGSVLGLSAAVLGVLVAVPERPGDVGCDLPLWIGVLACLGVGLLAGAANGAVVVRWGVPSFIVTLGMLEVARGLTYMLTQSRTAYIGLKIQPFAEASLGGMSLSFLIALAVVVLGQFLLSNTVFGRNLVALGCNEEAVRLSGIKVKPLRVTAFMLSGLLAALAAVIEVSKQQNAEPNAGKGYELEAIAAVVIGGTSLMGGRGSVVGTFLGVMIMAVLSSGLTAMGAREEHKRVITGAVIVVAVILDGYRSRLRP